MSTAFDESGQLYRIASTFWQCLLDRYQGSIFQAVRCICFDIAIFYGKRLKNTFIPPMHFHIAVRGGGSMFEQLSDECRQRGVPAVSPGMGWLSGRLADIVHHHVDLIAEEPCDHEMDL